MKKLMVIGFVLAFGFVLPSCDNGINTNPLTDDTISRFYHRVEEITTWSSLFQYVMNTQQLTVEEKLLVSYTYAVEALDIKNYAGAPSYRSVVSNTLINIWAHICIILASNSPIYLDLLVSTRNLVIDGISFDPWNYNSLALALAKIDERTHEPPSIYDQMVFVDGMLRDQRNI
jgi:hypothetical protein